MNVDLKTRQPIPADADRRTSLDHRYANDDFPEGAESGFARTVCASRHFFPGAELVKAAHFIHAEPPYLAEYDRIFRMPIVFGSDRNAMLTDAAWLDQRLQAPSLQVFEIVKARADRQLQRVASANSARDRVEALLTNHLHTAEVSIDAVAGRLGMGRHTLFRRLRAEGVTFKQVLNELRHKLAAQYLSDRTLAVSETARPPISSASPIRRRSRVHTSVDRS
jgi:Arabinose-binding domain of AraC transcription regulator, N-term